MILLILESLIPVMALLAVMAFSMGMALNLADWALGEKFSKRSQTDA